MVTLPFNCAMQFVSRRSSGGNNCGLAGGSPTALPNHRPRKSVVLARCRSETDEHRRGQSGNQSLQQAGTNGGLSGLFLSDGVLSIPALSSRSHRVWRLDWLFIPQVGPKGSGPSTDWLRRAVGAGCVRYDKKEGEKWPRPQLSCSW